MEHILLGVDPGTTTGLVVYSIEKRMFCTTLETETPELAVDSIMSLLQLFTNNGYDVKFVSERVDLNPEELRGKTQAGIRDALRVADSLWLLSNTYDVEHVEIGRADSKNFVADTQLIHHDWYHSSRHVRDAMRVVITYLAKYDRNFLRAWAN